MFRIGIIALGLLGLSGCAAHSHTGTASVHTRVVTVPATSRPARPSANHYWVAAHYNGGIYIQGRWVYRAPARTYTYSFGSVGQPLIRPTRPPASHRDRHPNRPAHTKVWVPGHYEGRGANRRWVPGHYVRRPAR
jgi:hypothetical protein